VVLVLIIQDYKKESPGIKPGASASPEMLQEGLAIGRIPNIIKEMEVSNI